MKYTSQLCCDKKNGRQNGLISQMLFSEFFKIMVNKVTCVGFREAIALLWIRPWLESNISLPAPQPGMPYLNDGLY